MNDARNRRDLADYVLSIVWQAKSALIKPESAWNRLHVDLRATIPKPTEKTTVDDFIQSLEDHKEIWLVTPRLDDESRWLPRGVLPVEPL